MTINWNYPTSVWVGENRIKDLSQACGNLGITNPLFVTDKDLVNLDMVINIILELKKNFNNLTVFSIGINNICPPYPNCVEDNMGEQDTSNCAQVSIIDEILPITYNLHNAYPNPFNPTTSISYQVQLSGDVTLNIYDVLGNRIKTLIDEPKAIGDYEIKWDGTNQMGEILSSGQYFYQLKVGDFVSTKKMVLLK